MTRCTLPSKRGPAGQTLKEIIQSYLTHNAPVQREYLRFYSTQKSLSDAITKASLAELRDGSRFSHQRLVRESALVALRDALVKVNFDSISTFTELHDRIVVAAGSVRGIGLLTIYDTAHRLGAYLRLTPTVVYLHAGVRRGAKALGLEDWKATLPMSAFPDEFQVLRPHQVEDCLCIYASELEAWARSKSGRSVAGNGQVRHVKRPVQKG